MSLFFWEQQQINTFSCGKMICIYLPEHRWVYLRFVLVLLWFFCCVLHMNTRSGCGGQITPTSPVLMGPVPVFPLTAGSMFSVHTHLHLPLTGLILSAQMLIISLTVGVIERYRRPASLAHPLHIMTEIYRQRERINSHSLFDV